MPVNCMIMFDLTSLRVAGLGQRMQCIVAQWRYGIREKLRIDLNWLISAVCSYMFLAPFNLLLHIKILMITIRTQSVYSVVKREVNFQHTVIQLKRFNLYIC